jgi:drug/metabolite transporter (DMT)-like permease
MTAASRMPLGVIRTTPASWAMFRRILEEVCAVAQAEGIAGAARGRLRTTLLLAVGSALCFALALISVQFAVPIYGNVQTLWSGRVVSLVLRRALCALRRRAPAAPGRWWPILAVQGLLDAGGYALLYAGSGGAGAELAAVASSGFGAVTTVLAWGLLRERIGAAQWAGIVLIFAGVAVLSA